MLPEIKHPLTRIVFYQAEASRATQSYRENASSAKPRFEVYFRGELRDSGDVTDRNVWIDAEYIGEKANNNNITDRGEVCLLPNVEIAELDEDDPFRSFCLPYYVVYTRDGNGNSLAKCKRLIATLRQFLDLPDEGELDQIGCDEAALEIIAIKERRAQKRADKRAKRGSKRGTAKPRPSKKEEPTSQQSPEELKRRQSRRERRAARERRMRGE